MKRAVRAVAAGALCADDVGGVSARISPRRAKHGIGKHWHRDMARARGAWVKYEGRATAANTNAAAWWDAPVFSRRSRLDRARLRVVQVGWEGLVE